MTRYIRFARSNLVALLICLALITVAYGSLGLGARASSDISGDLTAPGTVQAIGDHPAPPPPFQDPGHVHYPRGTIVGQFTPELIPSNLAVRMMLRAVATAWERDRSTSSRILPAYFTLIAGPAVNHQPDLFGEQQQQLLLQAALEYHRETAGEARPSASGSFGNHATNKANQVWARLRSTMTPDAFALVELHVNNRVKRGITIRP